MPIFDQGIDETPDLAAKADQTSAQSTGSARDFASTYLTGNIRTPGAAAAMTLGGSVVDLVDTAASSVIPGIERGEVNESFLGAIGSPGLNKWYNENKGAIEVGSGIAGIFAADFIAGRVLKPAGAVMKLAQQLPYVKKIATLDAQYASAVRVAQLTSRELARRGATGVERFVGTEINLAALSAPALKVTARSAAMNVRKAQLARGLVRNTTTEAIMAATLHTNSFLYDDDLAHNLAWGAAGLAIGGGIDNMVASYTLRKRANSQAGRRLNSGAYDPSGKELERLNAGGVADAIAKETGETINARPELWSGAGAVTDKITSQMIQAHELTKRGGFTERAMSLFSKREAIATPTRKQAFEEVNKVTVRGIRGMSRAGFGTKLEGLGAPILESLEREPAFLYGIEELGTTVDEMTRQGVVDQRNSIIKQRKDQVSQLLSEGGKWTNTRRKTKDGEIFVDELTPLNPNERDALELEMRELQFAESHVPVTMLEPGEWAPISMGAIADNYVPRQVTTESIGQGEGSVRMWTRERLDNKEPVLGIRSDGELFTPANAKIERLEMQDMLSMYQIGNKVVRDLAQHGGQFVLPAKPNWFQLDLAEQLLKATDNPAQVVWPAGMTRETALVESFAQKVEGVRKRSRAMSMAKLDPNDHEVFRNKVYFNLPRLNSYQAGLLGTTEHPFDILLNSYKSADEVRKTPYHEILKGMNDAKKIAGLTDDTTDTLDALHGNSFNFLMDRDGNAIKPIIGFKRPMQPAQWSQGELMVRQVTNAMYVRNHLMGETADPFTRELVEVLSSNPGFVMAGKVTELADDQHRSMVPGFGNAAPQSTMGAAINAITSRERRDVDNMTMLQASKIKELQTRVTQEAMRRIITNAMGDTITQINSPRNITSRLQLNQFHSFRQGWELMREPVEQALPKGKGFGFVLDHTSQLNQKRFKEAYGRDLTKGQLLLNPDSQAIVLDELAMETLGRMQQVHELTLAAKNTLLRSQGLTQIKSTPWYVPPPPTKGKYIGYTFDSQDNIVPQMTAIADTPEELARMKKELETSNQWRNGYTFRQRSDVESFMDLWDKAQMDYIAPNVTAIQPKKTNYGRTGGNVVNTKAFEEALVTMQDSIVMHGDDVLGVLFADPIKSAKARAAISRVESAAGSRTQEQHSSIFDRYVQNLTGRSSLGAKDSYLGEFYSAAERRLNGWLNSDVANSVADTYQALKDHLSIARPGHDRASVERFNKLSEELGQLMPFKSAMEMVERETGSRTPREVADLTAKLSWFEAASRLRWLESFHAVANIGGILSNTASVIRALQPMAGETVEQAAARNSSLAMTMATPSGTKFNIPHTNKLLYNAMKDAWKKVPDEFTKKAVRLGYMDQDVAEFNRQWGAIDSKEGWRGFVFGNEAADPSAATGIFGKAAAKVAKSGGLDKWMGVMSDKSEAFTRQWGMYAGKRVAESMGINDVDAQLAFAHEITNKLIANYDPRNRPEIFQGALGAPLGLFQSYVINYYQRMFRYLETGNSRALATQFATQGAVFGINSLPGWDAFNWAFFDQGQAENDDPVDSIYKRFGLYDGDLLMHGTLSNLPKLFGADGISLYTRGDSAIRMPVVNLPVADTIGRVVGGVGQALDTLQSTGKIGANHLAEIASNVVTNRPIAGMLEVWGANGFDTSFDAQVVSDANGMVESTYRVLGIKAMQQQKETELFYQNRNAQEEQNARKDILRNATRSAIRDGRFEEVPGLFNKYVEQGGDPRGYSKWVKNAFESALDTRGERMLEDALKDKDSSKNAYLARLLDAQVGVDEDEHNTEDYGREKAMNDVIQQGWETQPMQPPELEDPYAVPEGGL